MAYPVELEVDYPETLSRWLNNPLISIKPLLAIPRLIIVVFYGILTQVVRFIALFAILFTGRYPRGMFELNVDYYCWSYRVWAYTSALTDKYPPFSNGVEPGYPAGLTIEYPERLSRWLNNPYTVWAKSLLAIPHILALSLRQRCLLGVWFIAQWAILFNGRYPRVMFEFAAGCIRWNARLDAYTSSMTDQYPPFSGQPAAEIG